MYIMAKGQIRGNKETKKPKKEKVKVTAAQPQRLNIGEAPAKSKK